MNSFQVLEETEKAVSHIIDPPCDVELDSRVVHFISVSLV